MLTLEVEKNNFDYQEKKKLGYYEDSPIVIIIRIIALSIPIIIDFILSLLSYKKELENYYTLRFSTQGLFIIFIIINVLFTSYKLIATYGFYFAIYMIYIMLMVFGLFALLAMEYLSLYNFISEFESLVLSEKIGYYIHSLSIVGIVGFRLYFMKVFDDY